MDERTFFSLSPLFISPPQPLFSPTEIMALSFAGWMFEQVNLPESQFLYVRSENKIYLVKLLSEII